MQFIADIVKSMNIKNYITVDDLYKFSEKEVLQLIQNCEDNYIKNALSYETLFHNYSYLYILGRRYPIRLKISLEIVFICHFNHLSFIIFSVPLKMIFSCTYFKMIFHNT